MPPIRGPGLLCHVLRRDRLLALRQLGTSKHAGALALFDREFVKKSVFGQEHSRSLHELFDLRQRADYRDLFEISHERAESAIAVAEKFVDEVSTYLRTETEGLKDD